MRRTLCGIITLLVLALVGIGMNGCKVPDEFAPKQRTQIENYLSSNSMEYRLVGDSVYVHVAGNYALPDQQVVISKGDSVVFDVAAYTFSNTPSRTPYYTTKQWLAEQSFDPSLDTSYWDFEPIRIKLGDGSILNGVEEAFPDCINGDSVVVFLTSSNGYGDLHMGIVPRNTALMMVLNIRDVIEN